MSCTRFAAVLPALVLGMATLPAQAPTPLDDRAVALTYHAVTRKPLDVEAVAATSAAVRNATNFDRPDVINTEASRLRSELASMDPRREFVVRVNDALGEYDHQRGEFVVPLFTPGYYLDITALGASYRVVFDNAAAARAIAMPKEQARVLDTQVARNGRAVVDEIHFRVTGDGDPAGGVTGDRVVRATITSVRILDGDGRVLFEPDTRALATTVAKAAAFDARTSDVAGLRVGGTAAEFQQTVARLFGKADRISRSANWFSGYAGAVEVNAMGCFSLPGRRGGEPGSVCVTAFVDAGDVVRAVRIERVFPYIDGETFRATMVRRYGAVTDAKSGTGLALGWGPSVPAALAYDSTGPHTALTAHYTQDDDMMSRSLNAAPKIRVTLQLLDAAWAAGVK